MAARALISDSRRSSIFLGHAASKGVKLFARSQFAALPPPSAHLTPWHYIHTSRRRAVNPMVKPSRGETVTWDHHDVTNHGNDVTSVQGDTDVIVSYTQPEPSRSTQQLDSFSKSPNDVTSWKNNFRPATSTSTTGARNLIVVVVAG